MNSNPITEILTASMVDLVPLFEEHLAHGQSVRFKPKGISMLPMLRQGIDTVTLTAITDNPKKYDIVLYHRDNGKYVLHRIVGVGQTYTMIGDNQYVKEQGIRRDQIIATVTAYTRGDREYRMDSIRQQLYCRLWHHSRFPRRALRALKNMLKRIFR